MKIYGVNSDFTRYEKEPGWLYGQNDVLKAARSNVHYTTYSRIFGASHSEEIVHPRLHLHISTNAWSRFTGMLREYLLPWAWKAAYLDPEDGTPARRILVCTSVRDGELRDRMHKILGKSWFWTNFIKDNSDCYKEYLEKEYLCIPQERVQRQDLFHSFIPFAATTTVFNGEKLCHIFTKRGLFSSVKYDLLKRFSSEWKEVAIQAGQLSEKILIKRVDEERISRLGIIRPLS